MNETPSRDAEYERVRQVIFETLDEAFQYPTEADLDLLATKIRDVVIAQLFIVGARFDGCRRPERHTEEWQGHTLYACGCPLLNDGSGGDDA